ncbi:hypothetical protein [Chitinophaga sp. CB10]|uniref:hypothetical protein n=1 Tax=Chitinophaga sp. CB10 TaxID=1891659 RepID=UPI0025C4A392|nr:hypothetical protein [Chitinophaga sp. CB10]
MSLNSIYLAGGIAALLLFGACAKQVKNDPKIAVAPAGTEAVAPDPNGVRLHQFLRDNGPVMERYDVSMQDGITIKSRSGKVYTIGRNSLIRPDGSPATGPITLYIKEVSTAAGMIFADKPTATSAGEPLESFGEFYVAAKQGSVDLKLRPDSGVRVQAPAKVNAERIPMWNGDTTVTMDLTGYNYVNQLITVSTPVSANKGVDWNQVTNPASAFALFNGANGTLNFRLDSLLTWVNCDRLMSNPNPKTTVLAYFASNFNPATRTSYGGEEPTMLFFKPAGINSVIKFYNLIFMPPAGFEGFLSYQNTIPVGQAGTFLAISSIGGQFYAEQKDVVIPAPPAGQNYVAFSFNPTPVTPAQLISLINSMNTK